MKINAVKPSHRVKDLFPHKESKSLSAVAWFIHYTQLGGGRARSKCEHWKQKLISLTSVSHSQSYTERCLHVGTGQTQLPWYQATGSTPAALTTSQHPHATPLWCLMCLCSHYQQALGCKDQSESDFTLFSKRREFIPLIATCLQSRACFVF